MNSYAFMREAVAADAEEILQIYRPYVENTCVSFEQAVPSCQQMAERIDAVSQNYPWLVCLNHDNKIIGYTYATQFKAREAYRWTVEVTIYVDPQAKGKRIAAKLYHSLFVKLANLGFCNAIAVITEPNPESERFHQKVGFKKIGTFKSVGYKFGKWNDVGWWQKQLLQLPDAPTRPGEN